MASCTRGPIEDYEGLGPPLPLVDWDWAPLRYRMEATGVAVYWEDQQGHRK